MMRREKQMRTSRILTELMMRRSRRVQYRRRRGEPRKALVVSAVRVRDDDDEAGGGLAVPAVQAALRGQTAVSKLSASSEA